MKRIENNKLFEDVFRIFIETLKNPENLKNKQLKNQIFHVLTWYLAELYIWWKKRKASNSNSSNSSWLFDIVLETKDGNKYIDVKTGIYSFYENNEKLFYVQLWQVIKETLFILEQNGIKWFEEFNNKKYKNILTKNSEVDTETWIKLFWKFVKAIYDAYKKDPKILDVFWNYYKYIVIMDSYKYNIDIPWWKRVKAMTNAEIKKIKDFDYKKTEEKEKIRKEIRKKVIDKLEKEGYFDKMMKKFNNDIKYIKNNQDNYYVANFDNENNKYIIFDNNKYLVYEEKYWKELFSKEQKTYVVSILNNYDLIISLHWKNWKYSFFMWCNANITSIIEKAIVWIFMFSFKQFFKNLFVSMNNMKLDDNGEYMIEIFKDTVDKIDNNRWKEYTWNEIFELKYYGPCITGNNNNDNDNNNSEKKEYIYKSNFWNEEIWNFVIWFKKKINIYN